MQEEKREKLIKPKYSKGIRKYMVFFLLALGTLEVLAVFFPILLQEVAIAATKQVQGGDTSVTPLLLSGLLVLGFIVLIFAVQFTSEFLSHLYADKYQENIRNHLYEKFNKLSSAQIDQIGVSRILPIITNDSRWLKIFHRRLVTSVVFFPVAILGSFIMLFSLSWLYALFALISIPILFFFFWWKLRKVSKTVESSIEGFDQYFFNIREGITGAKDIRILGKAEERSQDFAKNVWDHRRQSYTVERSLATSVNFHAILFTLITIGIVLFATLTNRSTGETIVIVQLNTAIQYITRIWNGSHLMFTWFIDTGPRSRGTVRRLSAFYKMPEEAEQGGLKQIPIFKKNNIKLNNVTYKQCNGKVKLSDISMYFSENKLTGVAGGIDSGKGLVAEMLVKSNRPTEGTITFNEIDIEQINTSTWRNSFISYCESIPRFIPGTIRDNFKLFAPDITDEQILNTFKDLGASHFIKMFDNILDFEIKESTNLSEGTKNILSIVRAVLKPAQIYVFNQCFEHVKHTYITRLMALLKRNKKTAIFLSYDSSVCKQCDTIYVLNQGSISGSGTHAELIKNNKDYRELHSSTLGVMVYEEEKVEVSETSSEEVEPAEQIDEVHQ